MKFRIKLVCTNCIRHGTSQQEYPIEPPFLIVGCKTCRTTIRILAFLVPTAHCGVATSIGGLLKVEIVKGMW